MNLSLDIGNTKIKAGIFDGIKLVSVLELDRDKLIPSLEKLTKQYALEHCMVSDVAGLSAPIQSVLRKTLPYTLLSHQTPLPFENLYKSPKTLGVDRLALVAAAVGRFPGQNVLVIDAGSCITCDFVDDKKRYFGGSISPGLRMRYKAVHHFTANLPLLETPERIPDVGDNTANAIHKGILEGLISELNGRIDQFPNKNQTLTVVLTGGDTKFLSKHLKSSIFAIPNFLLEGLNSIWIHNKEE